jgi:ferredoxin
VQVSADRGKCISAGNCVLTVDAVFDQDDDGVVVVLDAGPPPAHHDAVRRAVAACPSGAISLREDP